MLYNGLDIYQAKIENETDGIVAISLVEYPAVESDFVCFSTDKIQKYSIENEDEHLISGVIMLADTPIYRRDGDYEYYITYSKETIKLMASKMLADGTFKNIDIQHNGKFISGAELVELYIKDESKGINPSFVSDVPDGSLMGTFHISNDYLWNEVKNGNFLNGFSLEGFFQVQKMNNNKKTYNIMNLIEKFMKKLMKFEEISTDKGVLLTVEGEELAIGVEVYVPVEGGWEPAADGEYKSDDETIIVVDGKVSEIKEYEMDEPAIDKPVEVQAEETVVVDEPVVDERDDKQEQIDALKGEIDALKGEIEGLKKVIADIVQKPVTEPIVEEFINATEPENKHNKAAKLLSNLNN